MTVEKRIVIKGWPALRGRLIVVVEIFFFTKREEMKMAESTAQCIYEINVDELYIYFF